MFTSSLRVAWASRRTLANKSLSDPIKIQKFVSSHRFIGKRSYSASSDKHPEGSNPSSGEGLKFLFPLAIILSGAFIFQDSLNISSFFDNKKKPEKPKESSPPERNSKPEQKEPTPALEEPTDQEKSQEPPTNEDTPSATHDNAATPEESVTVETNKNGNNSDSSKDSSSVSEDRPPKKE